VSVVARNPRLRQAPQQRQEAQPVGHPEPELEQAIDGRENGLDFALDVHIVEDVHLAQEEVAGRFQHGAERTRISQNEGDTRRSGTVRRPPGRALPQADRNVAHAGVAQQFIEELERSIARRIGDKSLV
jgi:hypothetical protein